MRVAFDAGPLLDPPTGIGRYTSELAEALQLRGLELVKYAVAAGFGSKTTTDPGELKRWRLPARVVQFAWRRFDLPAITRLVGDVDLVHATNFVMPPLGGVPGVVTIHDLSFLRSDTFPGGQRLRDLVPWSIDRAARVLVPTHTVAKEVIEEYALEATKVAVTYEGVAPRFFGATPLSESSLAGLGIPGPFILAVGTLEPRKNLGTLLEAWNRARRELKGWSLVLAGPRGWGRELPRTEDVVFTGWIGDETLPGLLSAAQVFCYPSFYEGFGLPPLEAMAAGTPVIVGDYSCAAEVLGDAARRVAPNDRDGFATAMIELIADDARRRSMQVAGRARASAYTWERAAQATIEAYEDVIDA